MPYAAAVAGTVAVDAGVAAVASVDVEASLAAGVASVRAVLGLPTDTVFGAGLAPGRAAVRSRISSRMDGQHDSTDGEAVRETILQTDRTGRAVSG